MVRICVWIGNRSTSMVGSLSHREREQTERAAQLETNRGVDQLYSEDQRGAARHACASIRKARARGERPNPGGGRPCFSSALISPKVRAWPSGRNIGS